jgi:hypothetical protein
MLKVVTTAVSIAADRSSAIISDDPHPRRILDAMEYQDRERRRVSELPGNKRAPLRQRLAALFYRVFDRRKQP